MVRTLHADLNTAQQSASSTPYVRLVFHSFDRATTRTYALDDGTNRILQVQQAEGRYGSHTLAEGKPYTISSVIRLQNSDSNLSSLDFKGYRVYIEWGFNTSSGNKTSRSGPEVVVSQEMVSDKGISYLEIFTLSLWERANQVFVNVANVLPLAWVKGLASETKVSHILMQLLGGGELEAVIEEDPQSTFNDATTAAKTISSTVTLFTSAAQVNDAIYFGKTLKFDRLSIDLTQVLSSGSITVAWEYSKGSGVWGALSPLTEADGATARTHLDLTAATGILIEAFDMPSDWATDTVNSQGPYYYIRARASAVSSPVTAVTADLIFGGQDTAFQLDTSTAGQGDDYLPSYTTNPRSPLGTVVKDILSYTLLGVRAEEDGFHAAFVDNAQGSADETYDLDGNHVFHVHNENQGVVIPNRILVVSGDLSNGAATFSGTGDDSGSQGEIGIIPRIEIRQEITSDADAVTLAGVIIKQKIRDTLQGRVEVPIDVGQEVWDLISVVDARTGRTTTGRVSQLVRLYQPGRYLITSLMGGAIYSVGITGLPQAMFVSEDEQPSTRQVAGLLPPLGEDTVPFIGPPEAPRIELVPVPRARFDHAPGLTPGRVPTPTPPRQGQPEFASEDEQPSTGPFPTTVPRPRVSPAPGRGLTPLGRDLRNFIRRMLRLQ